MRRLKGWFDDVRTKIACFVVGLTLALGIPVLGSGCAGPGG